MTERNNDTYHPSSDYTVCDERGILVPLAAIIIGVLLFVALGLGVDVSRTKMARLEAEKKVREVCSLAADYIPFTSNVVDQVGTLIENNSQLTGSATITRVLIISPTPDTCHPISDGATCPGASPLVSGAAQDVNPGLITTSTCPVCQFIGDVRSTQPEILAKYPPFFWNEDQPNGHVACEITATVKTIFGTGATINAKAAYRKRLRNYRPGTEIILGIDPTVETRYIPPSAGTDDERFDFSGMAWGFDGQPEDPLRAGVSAFSNIRPPLKIQEWSDELKGHFAIPAGLTRNERRIGCYGPYQAARNIYLDTIVETLRHWETRTSTHVLFVNPENQAGGGLNWPNLIAEPPNDITSAEYQIPFVNWTTTRHSDPLVSDILCPFESCSDTHDHIDDWDELFHRVMVGQLRDCFHLYATGNGISSFEDTAIDHPDEANFEPVTFEGLDNVFDTIGANYTAADHWEQFDSGTNSPVNLTINEIVRTLGTVESCPFSSAIGISNAECYKTGIDNLPDSPSGIPGPEDVPSGAGPASLDPHIDATSIMAPGGLMGDVIAFLQYARGIGSAYTYPGNINPPSEAYTPSNSLIVNPGLNGTPKHVILVLSKRIDPGNIGAIAAEVAALEAQPDTEFTLVFFPTTHAAIDGTTNIEDHLAAAFNPNDNENQIWIIGPAGCTFSPPEEDFCYQFTWETLLDPLDWGPPTLDYIGALAKKMLEVRLFRKELVL